LKIRTLLALSLLYLLLPLGLFFGGWLQPAVSFAALLSTIASAAMGYRRLQPEGQLPQAPLWWLLIPAAGWAALSGAGEWVLQVGDWEKHNLVLHDLIVRPWPVRYAEGDGFYLCYYIAFYLVPALAGKLAGIRAALLVCFGWTTLGLWLSFAWLYILGRRNAWLPVCFMLSGNLLWLVKAPLGLLALLNGQGLTNAWRGNGHFLNALVPAGSVPLTFDSAAAGLLWIPQHQLGIWVAMGIWGAAWTGQISRKWVIPAGLALPFWSTVASIGFLPWLLFLFLKNPKVQKTETITALACIPALLILGAYFQGHMPLSQSGFFYAGVSAEKALIFLLLTWGIYYVFLRKQTTLTFYTFPFAGWTALCLIAGGSIYISNVNDFGNRFALATLWVVWLGSWEFAFFGKKGRTVMWIVLLLSAQYATKILLLAPGGQYQRVSVLPSSRLSEIGNRWPDLARYNATGDRVLANQYMGRSESFFARYLLPPDIKK
jgi:hypothetical protein